MPGNVSCFRRNVFCTRSQGRGRKKEKKAISEYRRDRPPPTSAAWRAGGRAGFRFMGKRNEGQAGLNFGAFVSPSRLCGVAFRCPGKRKEVQRKKKRKKEKGRMGERGRRRRTVCPLSLHQHRLRLESKETREKKEKRGREERRRAILASVPDWFSAVA